MRQLILRFTIFLSIVVPLYAHAHKPSDSYVALVAKSHIINGQWDVALRDLEFAIGIDANQDGSITWGEVKAREQAISNYVLPHLKISEPNAICSLKYQDILIDHHSDGAYAVIKFTGQCPNEIEPKSTLSVQYDLFFDIDPQHRGLIRVSFDPDTEIRSTTGYESSRSLWEALQAGRESIVVFSPDHKTQTFGGNAVELGSQVTAFFKNGVWHIWTGFDHILFLISLLLPAVVRRVQNKWQAVSNFHEAFIHTLKVVTAFTVAHSITLSAAILGLISLPSRLVESLIAVSVCVAALNNIYQLFDEKKAWRVAFGFGLIHGFGFASALADMGLGRQSVVLSLLSFNVGVEIGQLAIVLSVLPIIFRSRNTATFQRYALMVGSGVICCVSLGWFFERAINLAILPWWLHG